MNTFIIYKAIKDRVHNIAPAGYYLGQYLKGDNTNYKVPAIYIEMPKSLNIDFLPGKLKVAKGALIKIHLVTNAPYKAHDNLVQDAAIEEHQNKLNALDKLLTGWHVVGADTKMLTQQFVPVSPANIGNFSGVNVFSILTYTTELYSRHLQ